MVYDPPDSDKELERIKNYAKLHLQKINNEILIEQINNCNTYVLLRPLHKGFRIPTHAVKSVRFVDSLTYKLLGLQVIEIMEVDMDLLRLKFEKAHNYYLQWAYRRIQDRKDLGEIE